LNLSQDAIVEAFSMQYAETYLLHGQSVFSHSIVLEAFTFTSHTMMCMFTKKEGLTNYRIDGFPSQ
jgi:hypothetical protein